MYNLTGKVAIITGAGSPIGLGHAISTRLAKEGCKLVLADICPLEKTEVVAGKMREYGAEVLSIQADISNPDDVERMVKSTLDYFGGLDILVNNAGVMKVKNFLDFSPNEWDLHYNVMVKGTYLCTQAAAKTMIATDTKGKIINMASVGGKRPWVYSAAYCACKAAIVSLTQVSASALAKHSINVNGIAPGDHWTEMLEICYTEGAKLEGITVGEFRKRALNSIPLGRLGTTDDIANTCAFLASDQADYITGQVLNVNGGMFME